MVDYKLHSVYDVRVGMEGKRLKKLLGKPENVTPIPNARGAEMWLYAQPKGHYIAAFFAADKLSFMDLMLDRPPKPVTVAKLVEMGFSSAISTYCVSAAAARLQQIGPLSEAQLRDVLENEVTTEAPAQIDPPGSALKHLEEILDRGLDLPGARSHMVKHTERGVEVHTGIGPDRESVRADRISRLWLLPDERIMVTETQL
jgi:hypothetical protein